MTTGIKLIETYDHDDFCSQLYDTIQAYENEGYAVELHPEVKIEREYNEFNNSVDHSKHLYLALVLAKTQDVQKTTTRAKKAQA